MSEHVALTSKQKKQLKGLAHHLEPIVRVGKSKISDAVLAELLRTLEAHELIKVRPTELETDGVILGKQNDGSL